MARANRRLSRPTGRALQWAAGLLAVVVAPKCLACLAAYFALATGLGTLGAEWCESPSARARWLGFITSDVRGLAGLTLAMCIAGTALLVARGRRRPR